MSIEEGTALVDTLLAAEGIKPDAPAATGENKKQSIEDLAAQYGWQSDGEKSAEEFVKVALDKFPDQSKKIKQLFRTVEELKEHMSKAETRAYEKAKAELDAQRKQAIYDGDVERVEALDKAREDLKPAMQMEAPAQTLHPAIAEFEERNAAWLNGTSYEELKMQQWVEAHGAILGRKKLPVDEHMALLEDHVKKEFSNYFNNNEETIASPVAASRENLTTPATRGKGKAPTFNDLSQEQKQIARDFEKMGVMSIDNYIKDLVKHGELK